MRKTHYIAKPFTIGNSSLKQDNVATSVFRRCLPQKYDHENSASMSGTHCISKPFNMDYLSQKQENAASLVCNDPAFRRWVS